MRRAELLSKLGRHEYLIYFALIKKKQMRFVSVAMFVLVAFSVKAQPIEWDLASGGNGHHYELVTTPANWFTANASANASSFGGVHGHLVTVTSQAEMDFIFNSFPTPTSFGPWLGLHDPQGDNTFEWVTGEPLVYTNWESITGEPSSVTEQCGHWFLPAVFGPDTWNDAVCTLSLAYIVEYDTVPPIPTVSEWGLIFLFLGFLSFGSAWMYGKSSEQLSTT